jgi:glycosyltransferase involved in cell wall biosynthesis
LNSNYTWAVVPAHNEAKHIESLLKNIKKFIDNVVVVDDGSKDNTKETAEKHSNDVLYHIVNMGKGAALKTGCDYAIKHGAQIIITIDADGQHCQ